MWLRAVRLDHYVLGVLCTQLFDELLVLGQSVVHDLFFKVFLAKGAVCLYIKPFGAAILVEVMLRVAFENDYFIFLLEFLLANTAVGFWNRFVVVAIWDAQESQDVGLQCVVVSLLCGVPDVVVDPLKSACHFRFCGLLFEMPIHMFKLGKSEVFFDLLSQMASLSKLCINDWLRFSVATGRDTDDECHQDEEPVEATDDSQCVSETTGFGEQLVSFTLVFVKFVGNEDEGVAQGEQNHRYS